MRKFLSCRAMPPLLAIFLAFGGLVSASSAHARPCLTKTEAVKTAKHSEAVHYRKVHGTQCWYVGEGAEKSEFDPPVARIKAPPPDDADERALCAGMRCLGPFKQQWPK